MEVEDSYQEEPNILQYYVQPSPVDIKIFQPTHILLPENSNCLSVKAFLQMCHVKYQVVEKTNAEDISPSGRVPFIKCDDILVSDLEPIFTFLRGKSLSAPLNVTSQHDIQVYMSLVNMSLLNAELYMTWVDSDTYTTYTKVRYSLKHPWPLSWILLSKKRQRALNRLHTLGWLDKSFKEVLEEVKTCCSILSMKLENKKYFYGDEPTELDALVYGHIHTILSTVLPSKEFTDTFRTYPQLIEHSFRIDTEFFSGP